MSISEKKREVKPVVTLERAADGLYDVVGDLEQRISVLYDLIGMVEDAQHQLAEQQD